MSVKNKTRTRSQWGEPWRALDGRTHKMSSTRRSARSPVTHQNSTWSLRDLALPINGTHNACAPYSEFPGSGFGDKFVPREYEGMYKVAIAAGVLALMPLTAYGQCVRMIGSNQIICPGYANSTSPVYAGPGQYGPGPGAVGAGQMVMGAGGLAVNGYQAYKGLPTPSVNYNVARTVNGYNNMQRGPIISYHPQIAYPASRPPGRRW
jgi:hypothetical protein